MLPAVLVAFSLGCGASVLLHMREVKRSDTLRLFLGGGSNSLALSTADGVFLTDAKFGNFTREMQAQLKVSLGQRVSRLLLTHSHSDHAGGLPQFAGTPVVIVHPNTRQRLEAQGSPKAPWMEVAKELNLWLDGEEVWIGYLGRGHTDGDLVAYLPREKLLVAGDLYLQGFAPIFDPSAGGSALEFEATAARMLALDFEEILPGHGELATRADFERFHRYLQQLKAQVSQGIAAGETEDAVAARVTLDEFADYGSLLGLSSREKNVRQMYRDLQEAARKRP